MPKLNHLFFAFIFINCISLSCLASAEVTQLTADTPTKTIDGNSFTAPKDWTMVQKGSATILESPEGGSFFVLVDVQADDGESAVNKAWQIYKLNDRKIKVSTKQADNNGWSHSTQYEYQVSPNEKRSLFAGSLFANNMWTVWIFDMDTAVADKRSAQVGLIFSSLIAKGYDTESFANKIPQQLDAKRLKELTQYIQTSMQNTKVPGVGLGIIQNNQVIFADGFGVKNIDSKEKVTADTLFMVASNTKAMTTLLLAKLVDEKKIAWDTPVIDIMPTFKLGDEKTTKSVLVEHLICACTGLPRKDMEWIFEFSGLTASKVMEEIANTQPTSDFGELFQYSNMLAAAAGYVAAYVAYPEMELGAGYDKAMDEMVFKPLGMQSTTFDFNAALNADHSDAFGTDIKGNTAIADMNFNRSVVPVRPAGAAWSNVNDMLKYVAFEMNAGQLPKGKQYISKQAVTERQKNKVALDEKSHYGMGLMVDKNYDVKVVHHGGDMVGFHSDMLWLPEFGVGAVILTNGDPGWLIRSGFRRKFLEVLFDGEPKADASIQTNSDNYFIRHAKSVKDFDALVDPKAVAKLAKVYSNEFLGEIKVISKDDKVQFDFGEWASQVTTKTNPDGTVSFVMIDPGVVGFEFVLGESEKPELIMRDSQHEYVFTPQ